jgi:hypothetical protein
MAIDAIDPTSGDVIATYRQMAPKGNDKHGELFTVSAMDSNVTMTIPSWRDVANFRDWPRTALCVPLLLLDDQVRGRRAPQTCAHSGAIYRSCGRNFLRP